MYDVAVVGAGPAGATAARFLAVQGCRVVLFEAAQLGRDKPCGGGLTARARGELPGELHDTVCARIESAEVRAGARNRQRFALQTSGAVWMVRRAEFDRRLAESAAAEGAELRDGQTVANIDADGELFTVRTAGDVTRARVVLVAAGAETRLATAVGLTRPMAWRAPALEVEGCARSHRLDPLAVVFDYDVPGGYAWAFPKGERWNIGVLTTLSRPGPALRRHLQRVIAEWGLDFDDRAAIRVVGRRIPLWRGRTPLHAGRVALLGDAAALADPFFGEGIAGALLSGRLAAAAAVDVISGQRDDLAPYSVAVDAAMRTHLRRARLAARLVYARPQAATWGLRAFPPLRRIAAALATEPFAAC